MFDTLYAEGQRRYVETFSPYARQFLDRMDKPQVDRIEGIPPAIAIDQTNPVRTSRSTVGTMTELNDHLKLLFARAGRAALPRLRPAGAPRHAATSIRDDRCDARARDAGDPRLLLTFPVPVPENFTRSRDPRAARAPGLHAHPRPQRGRTLQVVQDRFRAGSAGEQRAHRRCASRRRCKDRPGRLDVLPRSSRRRCRWPSRHAVRPAHRLALLAGAALRDCDIAYRDAEPEHLQLQLPIGACETCRGFGRSIGVDYGLVIPDES